MISQSLGVVYISLVSNSHFMRYPLSFVYPIIHVFIIYLCSLGSILLKFFYSFLYLSKLYLPFTDKLNVFSIFFSEFYLLCMFFSSTFVALSMSYSIFCASCVLVLFPIGVEILWGQKPSICCFFKALQAKYIECCLLSYWLIDYMDIFGRFVLVFKDLIWNLNHFCLLVFPCMLVCVKN